MGVVIITGVPGLDGEYEFDGIFSNRDLNTIKRLSGLRVNEIEEAREAGDNDLVVCVAVIALQRNGQPFDEQAVWDAEVGKITWRDEEDAEQAIPPQQGSSPTTAESSAISGPLSSDISEASSPAIANPNDSGDPISVTSSISDLETSAT